MKQTLLILAGLLVLTAYPKASQGAVLIVANETNGNVVFTASGTINLAGFTTFRNVSLLSGVYPVNPYGPYPPGVVVGGNSAGAFPADAYGGFPIGPTSFGSGNFRRADLVIGDRFGAGNNNSTREIFVPDQYQSGGALSGSSTYFTATFSSLGFIPGTYVWAWGAGSEADSLTLNIVPEPSTLTLALAALFLAAKLRRWRAADCLTDR